MRTTSILRCIYFLILMVAPARALHAQPPGQITNGETQCASLIRECFSYENVQRTNCFYSSATHPFCEGSELGALSSRRWVLSPNAGQNSSVHGFTGPQLIDKECIAKFDRRMKETLEQEPLGSDSIRQLASLIEECKKDLQLELQRQ